MILALTEEKLIHHYNSTHLEGWSWEKQPILTIALTQAFIMWLFSQCKHGDKENVPVVLQLESSMIHTQSCAFPDKTVRPAA